MHLFWSVGADGGNIFKLRTSSTTIVGIRRYDLDQSWSARACSWQPLVILAGPHEPTHLEHILAPTVAFFCDHDPGSLLHTRLFHWYEAYGVAVILRVAPLLPEVRANTCYVSHFCSAYAGRPGSMHYEFTIRPGGVETRIRHWPVLAFLEGDLMLMYKLMMTLTHSATRGCPRCAVSGEFLGGGMRCAPVSTHRWFVFRRVAFGSSSHGPVGTQFPAMCMSVNHMISQLLPQVFVSRDQFSKGPCYIRWSPGPYYPFT